MSQTRRDRPHLTFFILRPLPQLRLCCSVLSLKGFPLILIQFLIQFLAIFLLSLCMWTCYSSSGLWILVLPLFVSFLPGHLACSCLVVSSSFFRANKCQYSNKNQLQQSLQIICMYLHQLSKLHPLLRAVPSSARPSSTEFLSFVVFQYSSVRRTYIT